MRNSITAYAQPPLVSIIINCHNCAATLGETLESVKAQHYTWYEIIFWDNASTDASAQIAKDFVHSGLPLQYHYSESLQTLGAARNEALALARGKYIAFLDCDDIWLPQKLMLQVQKMEENPHVALLCTDTENFCDTLTLGRVFAAAKPQRGNVFADLMLRQWMSLSSVMLRQSALDALDADASDSQENNVRAYFDIRLHLCEEAELFYRIARMFPCDYIDHVLTRRRIHKYNATFTQWSKIAAETRYIVQKFSALYPDFISHYSHVVYALQRRAQFQEAVDFWRQGRGQQARKSLCTGVDKESARTFWSLSHKEKLLYLLSYLPKACFSLAVKAYFLLPRLWRG